MKKSVNNLPENFDIRLGDFGNSIHMSEVCKYYEEFDIQTLSYRAPEVLLGIYIYICTFTFTYIYVYIGREFLWIFVYIFIYVYIYLNMYKYTAFLSIKIHISTYMSTSV
jgi:hypothetical protein